MNIINRYIFKEFFKYLFIILLLVLSIQIAVEFLNSIDRFAKAGATLSTGFIYVLLNTPRTIVLLIPVAGIISIIVTYGLMNRNNELIALRSCGASLGILIKPAVIIGVVLTLFFFLISDRVVPQTRTVANMMKRSDFGKKNLVSTDQLDIWKTSDNLITSVRLYSPGNGIMKGIKVFFINDEFKMTRRIDAQSGSFENNKWVLRDVIEQVLNKEGNDYQVNKHEILLQDINISSEDLRSVVKSSEEMSLVDMKRYINKISKEGYDAMIYRVDFHDKFAFPFVCFFLSIIGASIAMRTTMRNKITICVALGLAISFSYWFIRSFFLSMGYGGVFPPVVAAWSATILFLLLTYIVYTYAD